MNMAVSPTSVASGRPFAEYLTRFKIPGDSSGASCLDLTNLGSEFAACLQQRGAAHVESFDPHVAGGGIQEALLAINGQFDYIFVFLDLFFDCDLQIVGSFLRTRVKSRGIIAAETTTSGSLFERRWTATTVDQELHVLPSFGEVVEGILSGLSVRDVGRSPEGLRSHRTSAFVCHRLQPIVLLIGGRSGSGKTTLAREFARSGVRVLNFDFLYSEIHYQAKTHSLNGMSEFMSRFDPSKIGTSIDKLVEDGYTEQLVNLTLPYFRSSAALTVAEGYQFAVPLILETTREKLTAEQFRVESLLLQ
jgi:hypothetical protein